MSKGENFKFFQHCECEYFPCHQIERVEDFNCLFCYCPLYALGKECGGNFTYTEKGVKNCSECTFPHEKKNFDKVLEKVRCLVEKMKG